MGFLSPAFIVSILIALTVHEAAHALVAYRLGDATAKYAGRLTLNPIAHLDPMGTILFLLVGFGWGKPVPVDPRYFAHPKRDNALVALAGPVSNLLLAVIAFVILHVLTLTVGNEMSFAMLDRVSHVSPLQGFLIQILQSSLFVNLGLMAFNLLPIAPLDGSKILEAFIPLQYEDFYEELMRRGPYILLAILIAERVLNFPFLSLWIMGISTAVLRLLGMLFGWV